MGIVGWLEINSAPLAGRLLQEAGETGEAGGAGASLLGPLVVLALVLLNGFFVATEFSMVTARRSRIEQLADEGQRAAGAARRAIRQLDRVIAGTQLGITIASLGLGWVGEPAVADLLVPLFETLPLPEEMHGAALHTIAFIISFSLITALHILLGELVPKAIALQRSEGTALFVALPMIIFMTAFGPVIRVLSGMGNAVLRLLGVEPAGEEAVHSVEDLRYLVTASRKAGVLEASEEQIATRAFTLGELTARRVMIPRTELVSVPEDVTLREIYELAAREHHVRFPVYSGDVDHVIGIIHLTDIVAWDRNHPDQPFSARAAMREALLVPESIEADRLLARMRRERTHVAVVIDEFGGVAGMITLQDMIERLVGEVPEIFEDDRPDIQIMPDGTTVVDGLTPVADLHTRFNIELREHEAETVGGYIMEFLGRVPEVGEELELGTYKLRIAEMDGPRIASVVLTSSEFRVPSSE